MDLSKMMKQAQRLQQEISEAQRRVEALEIEGISGGGMVSVSMTGTGRMKSLSINTTLLDGKDHELIEDLVLAAYNDGWEKAEKRRSEEMGSLGMGGKMPFSLG